MKKPIILTLVGCYLPGFRAGGPIRSIANLVENLGDEFDFRIITSDRDLGEKKPYTSVRINEFNEVGKARVFYASPKMMSLQNLRKLLRDIPYDVLYLNSFFNPRFTIQPLLLRRLGILPDKPVVVAPRGEFSEGALKRNFAKYFKKKMFVKVAGIVGLYKNVFWQASSAFEKQDIRRWIKELSPVYIVPNPPLSCKSHSIQKLYRNRKKKKKNYLDIVFLSRISPMKNLEFALDVLKKTTKKCRLRIYGPLENKHYWEGCKKLINEMPSNVIVSYEGCVPSEEVPKVLANHDLLFLPTRGENFGHVIYEALTVGTPVLISDRTPWRNLERKVAGWDMPLENSDLFVRVIDLLISLDYSDYCEFSGGARKYSEDYINENKTFNIYKDFIENVIEGKTNAML